MAVLQAHQSFRRRAHQLDLAQVAEKHIGRWIEQAQCPIGLKGIQAGLTREAHREHDLVDLSGGNVLFGQVYRRDELCFAHAGSGRRETAAAIADGHRAAQRIHDVLAQQSPFRV